MCFQCVAEVGLHGRPVAVTLTDRRPKPVWKRNEPKPRLVGRLLRAKNAAVVGSVQTLAPPRPVIFRGNDHAPTLPVGVEERATASSIRLWVGAPG